MQSKTLENTNRKAGHKVIAINRDLDESNEACCYGEVREVKIRRKSIHIAVFEILRSSASLPLNFLVVTLMDEIQLLVTELDISNIDAEKHF